MAANTPIVHGLATRKVESGALKSQSVTQSTSIATEARSNTDKVMAPPPGDPVDIVPIEGDKHLLGIPGELRNRIYDFVFTPSPTGSFMIDGKLQGTPHQVNDFVHKDPTDYQPIHILRFRESVSARFA